MSTVTGRRLSPQRQRDIKGERKAGTQSKAQSEAPGRKAPGDDCPFPNKPVSHRRLFNSGTHQSTGLYTSEKITQQPRDHDVGQKHCPNGIRDTAGSQHGTKKEIQLTKAIHEKQLRLQEKLWQVEEKVKQKLAEAAGKNDEGKRGERRQSGETKEAQIRQSRSADIHQERKQVETIKTLQRQRKPEAVKGLQSNENRNNESYEQKVSRDADKSRWEKVTEESRHNRDDGDRKEEGLTSRGGTAKQKGQTTGGVGLSGREKERMYDDRVTKEMADHEASWESTVPQDFVPSHEEELEFLQDADVNIERIPCKICNRKFVGERLEKHLQICKKAKQSQRQVFNSYLNRTRGSALEEFLKTHSRCKTPEVGYEKYQPIISQLYKNVKRLV